MSIESLRMKVAEAVMKGHLEEAKLSIPDLFDMLVYFIDDPKEFIEIPEQNQMLKINLKDLDEQRWKLWKRKVGEPVAIPYRGKRVMMEIKANGDLVFENVNKEKDFRNYIKALMTLMSQRFQEEEKKKKKEAEQKAFDEPTEAVREKGRKILEMPEIQKKLGEFGAETKYLTSERDTKAQSAFKLQEARRTAMKNKVLEEFVKHLIDSNRIHYLFWKDNPDMEELGFINLFATEYGGVQLFPPDQTYYDVEDMFRSDKALAPFENLEFINPVRTFSRKRIIEESWGDVENLEDYLRDQGDLAEGKVYKEYDVGFSAFKNILEGDNRKFMLVYLQKKFNISEADIMKMIEDEKEALGVKQKEKKEKEEKKKEKKKEKREKVKEKVSGVGIPQGKANAKVFTRDEYLKAIGELYGEEIKERSAKRIPEGKKVKAYLARTVIHYELTD